MIYLICGQDYYRICEKIKEISSEFHDEEIINIDGSSNSFKIDILIEECETISIFTPKKLLLVKDPFFLFQKVKKEDEKALNNFISYCQKPSYDVSIIFYEDGFKFKKNLSAYKSLVSNAQVFDYLPLKYNEYLLYANELVDKYNLKLDKRLQKRLLDDCNLNLSLLKNNLEILALYPDSINDQTYAALVQKTEDDDAFNLINALMQKDMAASIKAYKNLSKNEDNVFGLLSLINSQLLYLYQVYYYQKHDKTLNEIMKLTKSSKSYRVQKAIETLNTLKESDLLSMMISLNDLNNTLRTTNDIDQALQMELFIIEMTGK